MKLLKVATLALLGLTAVFVNADEAVKVAAEVEEPAVVPVAEEAETFEFQAEVSRLMDIIINSLYSNREVFVRELISNAADALDKVRFKSLKDKEILDVEPNLHIQIKADKEAKTLTFTDTGLGMNKAELIKHLGVVANSGTSEFAEAALKGEDPLALIGQFGVGFYSVYLVADKVTVISRSIDGEQHIWESTANSVFTVGKDPRGNTMTRGTSIILQLKEDAEEFLNQGELEKIIARYSQFIDFPINLWTEKTVTEEVPIEEEPKEETDEEAKDASEENDELEVTEEDEKEPEEEKPKTKTVSKKVNEWKQLNEVKAIWTRDPKEVEEEDYKSFYASLVKDESSLSNEGYQDKIHFVAEGEITFRALLYVPSKAQRGLYDSLYEKTKNLKLYVRRVLISDQFDDFLPKYLNFVHGVVDSDDLPVNVSRETLAQSRVLKVMSKKITRKVLDMLKKMADASEEDDEEEEEEEEEGAEKEVEEKKEKEEKEDLYANFWEQYGKSIKLGVIDDRKNKSKLLKLLRFPTSASESKAVSLQSYVDRMPDDQKSIYYITGESLEKVKKSPFLERVTAKGYEVIYMVDPLDEYVVMQVQEFDGVTLQSVTKEGLKIGSKDDKKKMERLEKEFKPLTKWLQEVYGGSVAKVKVSSRIENSPCVVVSGQYGYSANMERIMKAQALSGQNSQFMNSQRTLEINPRHPIIKELKDRSEADAESEENKELAKLMLDSATLASGFTLEDTTSFVSRMQKVISLGLSIDPDAPIDEEPEEVPEEEEEEEAEEEEEEVVEVAHDEL